MLTFEQARARILEEVPVVGSERIDVCRSVGRVLAEDVYAREPLPGFDYSAMDGYAIALEDLHGEGPFTLRVKGESRTGGPIPRSIEPGTACRIFTGAPLPPRSDAVVIQEDVDRDQDCIRFARRPRRGENIRRAGEDLPAGALALPRGTRVTPMHRALLAALERTQVTVARRPVVSIVSTGDELREPGEPSRPGSVVDCNGPALASLVEACGGIPRRLPFARDELRAMQQALRDALEGADLLLTVGGVSVGEHDVVKPALAAAGIEMDFWKVAIKPGKPLAVGRAGAKRFLGLPGNPAAAMLTFVLFGAPLVRAMQGDRTPLPPLLRARLDREVSHATGRLEFARAKLDVRDGELWAKILEGQSSGSVPSMAWADALVLLPPEVAKFEAGTTVSVMRMADV